MSAITKEEIAAIFDGVRSGPASRQEEAALVLLEMEAEKDQVVYQLSDEELRAIQESREEVRRGEFATEDEVAALLARYRG